MVYMFYLWFDLDWRFSIGAVRVTFLITEHSACGDVTPFSLQFFLVYSVWVPAYISKMCTSV